MGVGRRATGWETGRVDEILRDGVANEGRVVRRGAHVLRPPDGGCPASGTGAVDSRDAAVDPQHCSGGVARRVRGEVEGRTDHLVGLTPRPRAWRRRTSVSKASRSHSLDTSVKNGPAMMQLTRTVGP